jgi:hypothetical protein
MAASIWAPGSTSTPTLPAVAPVQFVKGTAALPGITFVDDIETGIWSQTDGYLQLTVNGVTRVTIDPTGRVTFNGKVITNTEVDIASSTVCDIGAVGTNSVRITGTNDITSFGTTYAGPMFVRFESALTLAHSSALILPGSANITVAAGDTLLVTPKATAGVADGWVVLSYERAATAVITGDYLNTPREDIVAATATDIDAQAPDTRNINILGTTTITSFVIGIDRVYFVRFAAALTLTNNSSIVTQTGANITTSAGDTCILRATATNVVEVLSYSYAGIVPNGSISQAKLANPRTRGTRTSFTAVAATTLISDIPAWATEVVVMLSSFGTNGSSQPVLRLGPTAGPESSGYLGATGTTSSTTGIALTDGFSSSGVAHIVVVLRLLDLATNTWMASGAISRSDGASSQAIAATKPLAGALTQLQVTTTGAVDTFDTAGSYAVWYS